MKLVLNELSTPTQVLELDELVNDLIKMTIEFSENKLDKEQIKLHVPKSFLESDFGIQFYSHIYTTYDIEDLGLFNSLIDCPPTEAIIEDFESYNDRFHKVTTTFQNEEIEGIGLKASTYQLKNSALYSFNSNPFWQTTTIPTKAYSRPDRFNRNNLINFSIPALFFSCQTILIKAVLEKENWQPAITNFPFAKEASDCYQEKCKSALTNCKTGGEKISVYRHFGKLFANMNGYLFDERLSKLNTNDEHIRDIYCAGSARHRRFISIDVENGGFEFCDWDGTHLGAYGWLGNKISEPKVTTHSIRIT